MATLADVYGANLRALWTDDFADDVLSDDVGTADLTSSGSEEVETPLGNFALRFDSATEGLQTGAVPIPDGATSVQIGCGFSVEASPRTTGAVSYYYLYLQAGQIKFWFDDEAGGYFLSAFGTTADVTDDVGTLGVGWHTAVVDIRGGADASTNPLNLYIDGTLAYAHGSPLDSDPATTLDAANFSVVNVGYAEVEGWASASPFVAIKVGDFASGDALDAHGALVEYIGDLAADEGALLERSTSDTVSVADALGYKINETICVAASDTVSLSDTVSRRCDANRFDNDSVEVTDDARWIPPGTNLGDFEASIVRISPPWLKAETSEKFQRMQGKEFDSLRDWGDQAVRSAMPGFGATTTSLPLIANDMQIERGPNELDAHFITRLQRAVDSHRIQGNAFELLRQLAAWFSPDDDCPLRLVSNSAVWHEYDYGTGEITKTVVGDNWDWDGDATKTHRGWVIIDASTRGWEPWDVDDTGGTPDVGDGHLVGIGAEADEIDALRRIVSRWKPKGVLAEIIVAFVPGLFERTDTAGSDNPDGEYGDPTMRSEDAAYLGGAT